MLRNIYSVSRGLRVLHKKEKKAINLPFIPNNIINVLNGHYDKLTT